MIPCNKIFRTLFLTKTSGFQVAQLVAPFTAGRDLPPRPVERWNETAAGIPSCGYATAATSASRGARLHAGIVEVQCGLATRAPPRIWGYVNDDDGKLIAAANAGERLCD